MSTQAIIASIGVAAFVSAAIGYWFGRREIRDSRVILTSEDDVAALSRRTRRAF